MAKLSIGIVGPVGPQPILAAAFEAAFFALLKYSLMKVPLPIRAPRRADRRKRSLRGVSSRRSLLLRRLQGRKPTTIC
jgi:hypothetical protein